MPAEHFTPPTEMSVQDQERSSNVDPRHGGSEVDVRTLSGTETCGSHLRPPTSPAPKHQTRGNDDDARLNEVAEALSGWTGLSVPDLTEALSGWTRLSVRERRNRITAALARRYAVKKETFVERLHTAYLKRKEQDLIEDVPSEGETRRAMREFMTNFLRFESDRKAEGLASVLPFPVLHHLLILARAFLSIANSEQGWSRQEHDEFCQLFSL